MIWLCKHDTKWDFHKIKYFRHVLFSGKHPNHQKKNHKTVKKGKTLKVLAWLHLLVFHYRFFIGTVPWLPSRRSKDIIVTFNKRSAQYLVNKNWISYLRKHFFMIAVVLLWVFFLEITGKFSWKILSDLVRLSKIFVALFFFWRYRCILGLV